MNIGFVSPKGGQGVTVTACSFAVLLSRLTPVCIVGDEDTCAALGIPTSATEVGAKPYQITDTLFFSTSPQDGMENVLDGKEGDVSYLVTRPCYLALRRAVGNVPASVKGIVMIDEPNRALSAIDVESALGVKVSVVLTIDATIARLVDAGLLAMRVPHASERLIDLPVVNSLTNR